MEYGKFVSEAPSGRNLYRDMMKGILLFWAVLLVGNATMAQSAATLGDAYFKNGECDKAVVEYAKALRQGFNATVAQNYAGCMRKLDKPDDARKVLDRLAGKDVDNAVFYAILSGSLARSNADTTVAPRYFENALQKAKVSVMQSERAAMAFSDAQEPRWAIKTLETARTMTNDPTAYSTELSALYRATGDTEKFIIEAINAGLPEGKRETTLIALKGLVETKDESALEAAIYKLIQAKPNELYYNELLIWYTVQKQKFAKALTLEKSIDKRSKLDGRRVFDFGNLAMTNKEYKVAANAFEYISESYPQGPYYASARRLIIKAREEQTRNAYPVDTVEVRKLIGDYRKVLQEVGNNAKTIEALRSISSLYASYLNKPDTAISVLDLATQIGQADRNFVDKCKLDKGDIYLLKGEPWEATLLYQQVEKSQKDDLLGYEAKLKNAKLQYYKGDFAAAKDILDILKMATTREIANDAGQLSLIIQDNTGLDSTEAAMREYAAADLLLFQNQVDKAVDNLGKLLIKYPDHSLTDEVLWLRANTYLKQGRVEAGLKDLKTISEKFSTDILGDDALFLTATITEEKLKDKPEAMKLYQKVLVDFPGSIHVVEARKRFRALRGDNLN